MVIHKACAATTKCAFKTICILIFTFTLKRNFVLKKMDFFHNTTKRKSAFKTRNPKFE